MEITQLMGLVWLGIVVLGTFIYVYRSNSNRLMHIIQFLLDNNRPINDRNHSKALATSFKALQDARCKNKTILTAYKANRKELFRQYTIEKQLKTEKQELLEKLSAAQEALAEHRNRFMALGIGGLLDKRI